MLVIGKIKLFIRFVIKLFLLLSKWEKRLVLILLLIIIISITLLILKNSSKNYQYEPAIGGIYREGIIANSSSDIQPTIDELTKIGLVTYDKDKNILPSLASEWKISDDQKTYTFKIQNFTKSSQIAEIIKKEKPDWTDLQLQTPDDATLIIILKQPFGPLLANLTQPLFPYGPYQTSQQTSSEVKLTARKDFFGGEPKISQIELKFYPSDDNLNKALKSHQIDGIGNYSSDIGPLPTNWQVYSLDLPRYEVLFFNMRRDVIKDQNVRKKLASKQKLDKPINLVLVTSDSSQYLNEAQELKNQWQDLGATVEIQSKNNKDLQQITIPARDYDVLLYGLDYGRDPDPYPFWHSSQATNTGLNLSDFSNVDADKLLEDARLISNAEDRNKKYQAFQKILDEEVPAIIIEQVKWQYAVSNQIKGIIDHQAVSGSDRFFEVYKWYIRTQRVRR